MPVLQVSFHPDTKTATVQDNNAAVPAGATKVGTFDHPDLTYPDSYVIFHGVRELLYKRKPDGTVGFWPDNITDLDTINIVNTAAIPVKGITLGIAAPYVEEGETAQLNVFVDPPDATNKAVTYTSSDTDVATVSATGLITAVATGTSTITVKSADGAKEATVVITVYEAG